MKRFGEWILLAWVAIFLTIFACLLAGRVPNFSPLLNVDWQAIGAIATFVAVGSALWIADSDRRQRDAERAGAARRAARIGIFEAHIVRFTLARIRKRLRAAIEDDDAEREVCTLTLEDSAQLSLPTLGTANALLGALAADEAEALNMFIGRVPHFCRTTAARRGVGTMRWIKHSFVAASVLQLAANRACEILYKAQGSPDNYANDKGMSVDDEEQLLVRKIRTELRTPRRVRPRVAKIDLS